MARSLSRMAQDSLVCRSIREIAVRHSASIAAVVPWFELGGFNIEFWWRNRCLGAPGIVSVFRR